MGREPRVGERLGYCQPLKRVLVQDLLNQVTSLCVIASGVNDPHQVEVESLPSESHSGSSYPPLMIFSRITISSSSSNGKPPVSNVYRMIPKDQTSTSDVIKSGLICRVVTKLTWPKILLPLQHLG